MRCHLALLLPLGISFSAITLAQNSKPINLEAADGVPEVRFSPDSGRYQIRNESNQWTLKGELGAPATHAALHRGTDLLGPFQEIDFDWTDGNALQGAIRRYDRLPVVWFRAHYVSALHSNGIRFPNFAFNGKGEIDNFSYQDRVFSPPKFGLVHTATPWLFFDENAHSMVVSPASHFMVACMRGDGEQIGVGLNEQVSAVPAGFDQDSVVVFSDGINAAWDLWGSSLQKLYRKHPPTNDADVYLKKFGYWTDNGADYYYNYDLSKGYTGTLLDLEARYREEGIPMGYLQLDSWWYQKSINDASGRPGGAKKNDRLPIGSWNRYGGTMEYRATPDLFPNGLAAFQKVVGLPLAVHGRWIDRESPYHAHYKFSGVGSVDPKWWSDTADYLRQSGVTCYEQDWLVSIYANSPEMESVVGVGDAFTDGMADACRRDGLSMQYCMATPRFFLQGLKYSNLTTIRTSDDRFDPGKWANFLYVSRLAHDVGIWPWCDVFKSHETGNMILSVLSAGPVGTGDAIGREDKNNILKAARPDGVIVKPDVPILPTDQTYLDGAKHSEDPFVASTFTDHSGLRTNYVFAFPRTRRNREAKFNLQDVGAKRASYVYSVTTSKGRVYQPTQQVSESIGAGGFAYFIVAPVTASGIAFLGDMGKFVPTGKQRISSLIETRDGLRVTVQFAKGEKSVILQGACPTIPKVRAVGGVAGGVAMDADSMMFAVEVRPAPGRQTMDVILSRG